MFHSKLAMLLVVWFPAGIGELNSAHVDSRSVAFRVCLHMRQAAEDCGLC